MQRNEALKHLDFAPNSSPTEKDIVARYKELVLKRHPDHASTHYPVLTAAEISNQFILFREAYFLLRAQCVRNQPAHAQLTQNIQKNKIKKFNVAQEAGYARTRIDQMHYYWQPMQASFARNVIDFCLPQNLAKEYEHEMALSNQSGGRAHVYNEVYIDWEALIFEANGKVSLFDNYFFDEEIIFDLKSLQPALTEDGQVIESSKEAIAEFILFKVEQRLRSSSKLWDFYLKAGKQEDGLNSTQKNNLRILLDLWINCIIQSPTSSESVGIINNLNEMLNGYRYKKEQYQFELIKNALLFAIEQYPDQRVVLITVFAPLLKKNDIGTLTTYSFSSRVFGSMHWREIETRYPEAVKAVKEQNQPKLLTFPEKSGML